MVGELLLSISPCRPSGVNVGGPSLGFFTTSELPVDSRLTGADTDEEVEGFLGAGAETLVLTSDFDPESKKT